MPENLSALKVLRSDVPDISASRYLPSAAIFDKHPYDYRQTSIKETDGLGMNLKHMRSFVVLAEELHFGRAADRLHIVQPALTQHIHQLEDELGVQLLVRSSRKASLTDAGEVFFKEASVALQQVEFARQSASDATEGLAGRLTIGFVDNAVWSIFPGIIRTFRSKYPRVELDLRQLARGPQMAALEKGELDIAILPGPVSKTHIITHQLTQAPLDLVLPSGHRLCSMKTVPIKALEKEPFISFASADSAMRVNEIVQNLCADHGFTPILGQAVHQMHTALALVSTGFGVAVVPRWMRRAWTDNVEYRPLKPAINYELLIATMEGRNRPAIALFCDISKQFVMERNDQRDAIY